MFFLFLLFTLHVVKCDQSSHVASSSPSIVFPSTALPLPQEQSEYDAACKSHGKLLPCTVTEVTCEPEPSFPFVEEGQEAQEPHDLRVNNIVKASGKDSKYSLHVNVQWEMLLRNDSRRGKWFLLLVDHDDYDGENEPPRCFLYNITQLNGALNATSSMTFTFSSDRIFKFGATYALTVKSLPRSAQKERLASKRLQMNNVPEHSTAADNNTNEACSNGVNPMAVHWTAGFRKIIISTVQRSITIQFIAAPPSLCFEAYEISLQPQYSFDAPSTIISSDDHKTKIIYNKDLKISHENGTVLYIGECTFDNLKYDLKYQPQVIPIEQSNDGRCLCPVNDDPSDRHSVCSCIAAMWQLVDIGSEEASSQPNISATTHNIPINNTETGMNRLFLTMLILLSFICTMALLCAALCCLARRYKSRGKLVRTRFINGNPSQQLLIDNKGLANATCASQQWSVLIVYSHDCQLHEEVVLAFAEMLRDHFNFTVHLDAWDQKEIEEHLFSYISGSVLGVDKVLVVNSIGAYSRLQARVMLESLQRVNAQSLDDIFEQQIDMALQHSRVFSIRFSYTPASATLYSLTPLLNYCVPANLGLLMSALTEAAGKTDPRLSGEESAATAKLRAAITAMQRYVDEEPYWFESSHRRVALKAAPLRALPPPQTCTIPLLPSIPYASATPSTDAAWVESGDSSVGTCEETQESDVSLDHQPLLPSSSPLVQTIHVPAMTIKADYESSRTDDSAYLSGDYAQSGVHPQSIEKSRLEEEESVDSGKDEESLDDMSSRRGSSHFGQDDHLIRKKIDDRLNSNEDSGQISDFHSELVENY